MKKVVLDTNIVLNDPSVVLREDISIVLPYTVLAELDKLKRDNELRFVAQLAIKNIKKSYVDGKISIIDIPNELTTNDEKIVNSAKKENASIWTDDVGASIIAMANGVDLYLDEESNVEYDEKYTGYSEWIVPSQIYYDLLNKENQYQIPEIEEFTDVRAVVNEYVKIAPDDGSLNYRLFRKRSNDYIFVSESKKLFSALGNVSGSGDKHGLGFEFLHPEQAMAFDAVFNSDTPLAVIAGEIGSGKTLISTVAALARTAGTHTNKKYERILVTRPNRPISKDYEIGFLPGDADAKLKSWLSGFTSNLEFLYERNLKDIEEEKASQVFSKYFKSVPIESVQGASFHNCIFLIDEAQLLDALALKQIMSRLADTSKCVLIMDPKQTYGMNRGREGYRRLLPRCKGNELISFVKLQHIQRSPLTKLVNSIFEDVR